MLLAFFKVTYALKYSLGFQKKFLRKFNLQHFNIYYPDGLMHGCI